MTGQVPGGLTEWSIVVLRLRIMGMAARKLEEVKARQQRADESLRLTLAASDAANDGAPHLWDDLRDYVESEVKQFSEGLPAAKHLSSYRDNENKLVVETNVLPIVKLEIVRSGMYVQASRWELRPQCNSEKLAKAGRYKFTVDRKLNPCLTDGENVLHPTQVADRWLKPVFDFFDDPA